MADLIGSEASAFDAVLLDVDNGPEALIRKANDALYDTRRTKRSSPRVAAGRRAGGLVVWTKRCIFKTASSSRFWSYEVGVRATSKRSGARHIIWLATKSKAGSRIGSRPPSSARSKTAR